MRNVDAAKQAAVTEAPREPEDPRESDPHYGQPLPGDGATEALGELVKSTQSGTQVRALLDLIDGDEIKATTLAAAASEASLEPHQVAEKASKVIEAFKAQAASVAESFGANAEAFFSWAREHRAGDVKRAMQQHGMQRSTAGYVPLVQSYMQDLDRIDPNAILSADFPDKGVSAFRSDSDGRIVLNIPGRGQVPWSTAVKIGLVKPRLINKG